MIRLIIAGVILAVLVIGGLWLNTIPWQVVLERENQPDYAISMTGVALALAVLGAIIAFVWSLLTGVWRLPHTITQMRKRSRKRKGNEALASGLLAVEGGDLKGAKRLANKAMADAEDERLALLLEARTAEQEQDWTKAERAYAELSRKPGAHLAGLKGLTGAAVKRGDYAMAIERAREALEMKGETGDWPFKSLFEIFVARADWPEARKVLSIGESKGHVETAVSRRRRSVLLLADAHGKMSADPEGAEALLKEAVKLAPGLPPAAFHLAKLQIARGMKKQAASTLEHAWKVRPHPALAFVAERIDKSALTGLINANKTHRETALLKADQFISEGNWDEAEKALAPLLQGVSPTSRVCRLMEMIARARSDDDAVRNWQGKERNAPREPEWTDIETDGSAFDYSSEDWARLVYVYGDGEQLIHPRHEAYRAELDVVRNRALPAPHLDKATPATGQTSQASADKKPVAPPAVDYVEKP